MSVEAGHRRISYSTPFDAADAASGRRVSLREMPSFKSEVRKQEVPEIVLIPIVY